MTNSAKDKGDRAERELSTLLNNLLGVNARRKLGAGRMDDEGDIDGVPDTTIQVADWANVTSAVRIKPVECVQQQERAGTTFGVTAIRLRGGDWRFVMTAEQFATIWREATQP